MEEFVRYTKSQAVARIELNRPAQLNALNAGMLRGLLDAIEDAEQDPEVRSILLTGAGEAFCAGGDLGIIEQWSRSSAVEVYRSMREVGRVVLRVYDVPKPLITAVNGAAVGGGCSLALCGDVILASDRARFGMVFSRYNLGPDMGGSYILPRLVGVLRAKELIYTGKIITAQEALAYGMVNEVIPHERLMEEAEKRAQKMARWATQAIGMAKGLIHASLAGGDLSEALEREAEVQALLFQSEDTREAIRAFLESRKPQFRNR